MRAAKKLIEKNTRLQNHNAALVCENRALRSLIDDAYGLLIDHHSSWRMVQAVCEVCSDPIKRMTVHRLERIRQELNTERVMAKQDERPIVSLLWYSYFVVFLVWICGG